MNAHTLIGQLAITLPLSVLVALIAQRRLGGCAWLGPLFILATGGIGARVQVHAVNAVILERFFLLPHVITAPLASLGVAAVADRARSLTQWRPAPSIVLAATVVATAGLAVTTYPQVDRRDDQVARGYGLDILASVDDGSVLLTAGDDTSTAVAYLQLVERARPGVIHVMQPLLRTDWYVRELRARRPDLAIPFDRLGGPATLRQLVDANPGRTFAVAGGLLDDSLRGSHWLYTKGLVSVIKPLPAGGSVDELARENDGLLTSYHVPSSEDVRGRQ